jgi:hypothetical protein
MALCDFPLLLLAVCCIAIFASTNVLADGETHTYQFQEQVPFYVNKIGPYSNPSETYEYYSLPFCPPAHKEIQHRHASLGETLEGDAISNSLYDIRFGGTGNIFHFPLFLTCSNTQHLSPLSSRHSMATTLQASTCKGRDY